MLKYKEHLISITKELLDIKDRVVYFVGNKSPNDIGKSREEILTNVLRRMLPDIVRVGTGFIIGDDDVRTKQIDRIIYDSRYAMIYKEGDLIFAPKESVLGIIEVKSSLNSKEAVEAIKNSVHNARIIMNIGYGQDRTACYNKDSGQHSPFVGIFSYESDDLTKDESVMTELQKANGFLNHVAFGKDTFVKYWGIINHENERNDYPYYRFYKIEDLAFGYFISNLIESVMLKTTGKPLPYTSQRALFPLDKENHLSGVPDVICSFTVDNPAIRSISEKNQAILETEETFANHLIKYIEKENKGKTKINYIFHCVSKKNIEERYDFQKFCQVFNSQGYEVVSDYEVYENDDYYFLIKHGDEMTPDNQVHFIRKEDWYN